VDFGGPQEAQVQSYSPDWANVLSLDGKLAPLSESSVCGNDAALCQITLTACFCMSTEEVTETLLP